MQQYILRNSYTKGWNFEKKMEVHVHVLEVELESACLSGQVRPPLYSFDSTQPLSCLGSSVVRASAQQAVCRGFESHPSSSFFFSEKRELFGLVALPFIGLRVFM